MSDLLPIPTLPDVVIEPLVRLALTEDFGRGGDITTDAVIPSDTRMRAVVGAREGGVAAGYDAARLALRLVDPDAKWTTLVQEGVAFEKGAQLIRIEGSARSVLMAERVMLNFIGPLSGVATLTARFVAEAKGTHAKITCTRKTTPGFRALEKRAVRLGGGVNHRLGLDDAILIKDNHVAVCGGVVAALERARAQAGWLTPIEIEVDGLEQLAQTQGHQPEVIMLDNFSLEELREAVVLNNYVSKLEASGGVNLDTVRAIAETGVDAISVGALTHSAPALDIALDAV